MAVDLTKKQCVFFLLCSSIFFIDTRHLGSHCLLEGFYSYVINFNMSLRRTLYFYTSNETVRYSFRLNLNNTKLSLISFDQNHIVASLAPK